MVRRCVCPIYCPAMEVYVDITQGYRAEWYIHINL